jgi:hypothetical protein
MLLGVLACDVACICLIWCYLVSIWSETWSEIWSEIWGCELMITIWDICNPITLTVTLVDWSRWLNKSPCNMMNESSQPSNHYSMVSMQLVLLGRLGNSTNWCLSLVQCPEAHMSVQIAVLRPIASTKVLWFGTVCMECEHKILDYNGTHDILMMQWFMPVQSSMSTSSAMSGAAVGFHCVSTYLVSGSSQMIDLTCVCMTTAVIGS